MHILKVLLIIQAYFSVAYLQGAYKIILKRMEIVQQDEDFAHTEVTMTRISRYTVAFNINFDVKVDIPNHFKDHIRVYEFLNNEYRPFAINMVRTVCSFLEMEYKAFIYPDLVRIGGHMPKPKCPLLKGKYSVDNYTLNTELFPANLPFRNGLLEFKVMNGTTPCVTAHVYFILDRDVVIRERYS